MTTSPTSETPTASAPRPSRPDTEEIVALLPQLLSDPGEALLALRERHGPLVHITVEGTPVNVLIVNEPEIVRDVLVDRGHDLVKGRGLQTTRALLGDGLLTSEGEIHARHRRLVAPAFHRSRLERYARTMADRARAHVASWPRGETVDIHELMGSLMLDIVGRTLFDVDLTGDSAGIGGAVTDLLVHFGSQTPLGQLLGVEPDPEEEARAETALATLESLVTRLISDRRADPSDRGDLLSMLVAARDEDGDGSGLTDAEIRDEVMTLLLAGHETTANALSWTVHLLSHRPDIVDSCAVEADLIRLSRGNGADHRASPAETMERRPQSTAEIMERQPQLTAVLNESLRLFPPAWAMGREALRPVTLGGVDLPPEAQVLLTPWVLHRDDRFWDHPDEFMPQRWNSAEVASHHRFVFFPFGGGARSCIGEHFARMEAMTVLTEMLTQVTFRPLEGHMVGRDHSLTLRPAHGVMVELADRS